MVVQPSKTRLLGYKSRDDSKRGNYLQLGVESRAESLSRLLSLPPPPSCFRLTACLCRDVKAARCVFDCLCLCVGRVGLLQLSVWCRLLLCLTYDEFVQQSVKIGTFFFLREFHRRTDSDNPLSLCFTRHISEVP